MERPYGHHHHRHHQRRDDDDDDYGRDERPPQHRPPTYYQENEFAPPPPPPQTSYFQEPEYAAPPPPRPQSTYYQEPGYAPPTQVSHTYHSTESPGGYYPPPNANVTHVSHPLEPEPIQQPETHHSFKPHLPNFHHQSHETGSAAGFDLYSKPTYKVFCRAEPDYHLTIRGGKVVLARSDPSDQFQNWYKDEKYSTRAKDEEGSPSFSLVNKASGQAMKHSIGATHPVQLVPYNPDILDESVLWTESKNLGDSFRAVRMVNNVHLNMDAFHGDKKSGGVHDGTTIVLWKWNKGDNQRWKIVPQPR